MTADEKYMREAIKQAKKAYAIGEVPIGCVIVYQDKIHWLMRSFRQSVKQVRKWKTGGWKNVRCM